MAIEIKSRDDVQRMREAAKINVEVLTTLKKAAAPGVTTAQLDRLAVGVLEKHGAKAAFLGHPKGSRHPFPATITVSVNHELVHGIPSPHRRLADGDIVSLDCGTIYKGFVADSAFTMAVGSIPAKTQDLLDVTEKSLYVGIEESTAGN